MEDPKPAPSFGSRVKLVVAGVLALLVLVFVGQNTDVVSIRFIVWEFAMSRVLLILLTLIVGVIIGFIAARVPAGKSSAG